MDRRKHGAVFNPVDGGPGALAAAPEPPSGPPGPSGQSSPFALTELQYAYWIGEQGGYRLSTPAYLHRSFFAAALDVARLEAALRAVVRARPGLSVAFLPDGTQRLKARTLARTNFRALRNGRRQ